MKSARFPIKQKINQCLKVTLLFITIGRPNLAYADWSAKLQLEQLSCNGGTSHFDQKSGQDILDDSATPIQISARSEMNNNFEIVYSVNDGPDKIIPSEQIAGAYLISEGRANFQILKPDGDYFFYAMNKKPRIEEQILQGNAFEKDLSFEAGFSAESQGFLLNCKMRLSRFCESTTSICEVINPK